MDTKKPDPVAHAARLLRESAQELRETATLPPLHQWTGEDDAMARAAHDEYVAAADALEAWEISVGAPLCTGYDAARLEIESLQSRVQELGQQARECSDRKVVKLDARIKELEAKLDAVVAGGVEPLRKRECLHKIDEPDHFRGATQMVQAARHASQRDELLQVALDFIGTLTGMSPPPIETAPPEVFSPFYAFVDRVQAITAPQAQAAAPVVLPAPVAAQSRFTDTPSDTWDSCSVEHARSFGGTGYEVRYLYTEQQVRALLAAAPKPPAHEPLRCSCHTCWPIAADDPASAFMRLCPACGNKRCPKANDHRHACTGSNEPGQHGSAYPAHGITGEPQ